MTPTTGRFDEEPGRDCGGPGKGVLKLAPADVPSRLQSLVLRSFFFSKQNKNDGVFLNSPMKNINLCKPTKMCVLPGSVRCGDPY